MGQFVIRNQKKERKKERKKKGLNLAIVPLLLLLGVVLDDEGLFGLRNEGMALGLVTHEDGPQNQPWKLRHFSIKLLLLFDSIWVLFRIMWSPSPLAIKIELRACHLVSVPQKSDTDQKAMTTKTSVLIVGEYVEARSHGLMVKERGHGFESWRRI